MKRYKFEPSDLQLSRCLSALQNPPIILPLTSLIETAKTDFLAAEKLANLLLFSRRADAASWGGGTGLIASAGVNASNMDRRRENRTI